MTILKLFPNTTENIQLIIHLATEIHKKIIWLIKWKVFSISQAWEHKKSKLELARHESLTAQCLG